MICYLSLPHVWVKFTKIMFKISGRELLHNPKYNECYVVVSGQSDVLHINDAKHMICEEFEYTTYCSPKIKNAYPKVQSLSDAAIGTHDMLAILSNASIHYCPDNDDDEDDEDYDVSHVSNDVEHVKLENYRSLLWMTARLAGKIVKIPKDKEENCFYVAGIRYKTNIPQLKGKGFLDLKAYNEYMKSI